MSGGDLAQQLADVAAKLAEEEGLTYIHPFNDLEVATGQGTIAYEIFQDLPTWTSSWCPSAAAGWRRVCPPWPSCSTPT